MKNYFRKMIVPFMVFLFIFSVIVSNPLLAKKGKKYYKRTADYSSKYYIEGAYPIVIAADWYAVSEAFSKVGNKKRAEQTMEFAKRLEKLEQDEMKKPEGK